MMAKKIIILIIVLLLLFLTGCSQPTNLPKQAPPGSYEILRKAQIASEWQMYQLKIKVAAGSELPIVLKLASGDTVDGYFYVEEGSDLDFQITGKSLIYKPTGATGSGSVASDRFSFVVSQAQGSTYTLTFRNTADASARQTKTVAFVELIFPATGSIFSPLEAK